uniref:SWIM-type domain-containing protein n=1 Tax=Oryza brachyantha TaxID=4533 RepID=J3N7L0_ORYBR
MKSLHCHCQKMECEGIPCSHIFVVLKFLLIDIIPHCCVIVRWTMEAKETFSNMIKEFEIQMRLEGKVILTTLLKVYSRGGLFEKARELLTELEASSFAHDEMPYYILIDGLLKEWKIGEVVILFNEMKEKGVKSGKVSNNIANRRVSIDTMLIIHYNVEKSIYVTRS